MRPRDRPNPTEFTVNIGPWIIVATIILPALIAGWLASKKRRGEHLLAADEEPATGGGYVLDHLYRALVLPLVEFVGRMGWSLVLILAVVLTYRICDAIWGTFAYPFYLGELEYTNDDVAFASKFFGVGAIIAGLALGGLLLTTIGRMATLLIGGILAALTNLLYADMAVGGHYMEAFSGAIGFTYLIEQVPGIGDADLAKLDDHHRVREPRDWHSGRGLCRVAFLDRVEEVQRGPICLAVVAYAACRHAGPWGLGRDDRRPRLLRRLHPDHVDRPRSGCPRVLRMVSPEPRQGGGGGWSPLKPARSPRPSDQSGNSPLSRSTSPAR